jgi:uncharacterized protein YjeT (DUF2065 family)
VFIVGAVGLVLIVTGLFVLLIDKQYKIDQDDPDWRQ